MKKITYSLLGLTAAFCTAQAALVTGVTTSEGFVSGGGGDQTLTSYTDSTGTYSNLVFATGKEGDVGNNRLFGLGGTDPLTDAATQIDNRLDTGTLNTGNGNAAFADRYTFTGDITNVQQFVIFINGANDNFLNDVALYDAAGVQLGSTVDLSSAIGSGDNFATLDLYRTSNASTLANRRIYGYAVNIADFGAVDTSLISGVSFGAPAGADFQLVAAAVPEPGTYALLAGFAALGFVAMRRRQ